MATAGRKIDRTGTSRRPVPAACENKTPRGCEGRRLGTWLKVR